MSKAHSQQANGLRFKLGPSELKSVPTPTDHCLLHPDRSLSKERTGPSTVALVLARLGLALCRAPSFLLLQDFRVSTNTGRGPEPLARVRASQLFLLADHRKPSAWSPSSLVPMCWANSGQCLTLSEPGHPHLSPPHSASVERPAELLRGSKERSHTSSPALPVFWTRTLFLHEHLPPCSRGKL